MSYDLIVKTHPARGGSRTTAGELVELLRNVPELAACEIAALSVDGELAVDLIADAIEEGEINADEFVASCTLLDLKPDADDPGAAAAFAEWKWGADLAVLAMPRDEAQMEAAYAALVRFVKSRALRLEDPQFGHTLNLDSPGKYPPQWR